MENIRVNKAELVLKLKKNREGHRKQFLRGQAAYRKKVISTLDSALKSAREGGPINTFFQLVQPIDQTSDYDRAIKMLEMDVNDEVELSEHDFMCYVLDQWEWAARATVANTTYVGKGRRR